MRSARQPNGGGSLRTVTRELTAENTPRSPVVDALSRQVANGFVLYANYKHYHWQTYGPLFRDLHKMFDKFAQGVLGSLDELAERVRMIGQDPPSRLPDLIERASIASSLEARTMRDMIEEADRNELIVIKEMRDGARIADEHDDPGTVDIFSRLVQIHEKHEWWLRDILRREDGLTG
jgi:starvation-inducible DNA-binding protein